VAEVNLVEVFQRCCHLLEHWGGHPMAAGVSMAVQDVAAFTACFTETLSLMYADGLPEASLNVASWLGLEDLNESLLDELDRLHPFGQKNPEPVFGLKSVSLVEAVQSFGKKNFRFRLPPVNGRTIAGIAWGMGNLPGVGRPIDMAVRFSWNYWRGSRAPQVTLVDWKPSSA
jgi:single-stranded-DNA-specific exonuclease